MTYPNVWGIRVDDVRVSAVCLSGLTVSGGVRALDTGLLRCLRSVDIETGFLF